MLHTSPQNILWNPGCQLWRKQKNHNKYEVQGERKKSQVVMETVPKPVQPQRQHHTIMP